MAKGTPVTYEDLTEELKKKYDEVKALLEADLIGSFHRTRSHGIRWKGFAPEGALDGVDLSRVRRTHQVPAGRLTSGSSLAAPPFESRSDLIKTNVTLSDFNGQASDAQGVLNVDLTVGRKTIPTTFFIVDSKSTYAVLLGRDWIHANCCIPSTMHQCVIQWDGDEVEVVHADDSAEISTAGMGIWEASGQEPLSGINLDDCERIDVTKDGVRLVLVTGLTV
ncbi:hypothetical protein QYE76_017231 [Lolium multiflorum]|uniref:Uncharacterized protein n=1 Tax=Lolium multiflorum TaxID=4521 RepID=A0AAD8VB92_LOLMU|nr:hypothetical protein QYE76_017231 [Lolium multiflorum]